MLLTNLCGVIFLYEEKEIGISFDWCDYTNVVLFHSCLFWFIYINFKTKILPTAGAGAGEAACPPVFVPQEVQNFATSKNNERRKNNNEIKKSNLERKKSNDCNKWRK